MTRLIHIGLLMAVSGYGLADSSKGPDKALYRWVANPDMEARLVDRAEARLYDAIRDPEYMLNHWVDLPTSPAARNQKALRLSMREAILLALRYNANIKNIELDRIIQRYQLKLADNEFELQYALAGSANIDKSRYSGVGTATTQSYLATPELALKTKIGTEMALKMNNDVQAYGNYNPVMNFSVTQPLLRGFGPGVNTVTLENAVDSEYLNRLNLRQTVANQITQVISAYRALIVSGNNLENQRLQLKEARSSYKINEKKIEAGQLEPTGNVQQSYQIESLKLMVEQAENEFKTSSQNLLQTIGLDPQMHLSVPSDLRLERIVRPGLKSSIELALKNNSDYLALQMAYRADERAYTVAKNQQLWQLDLAANVQAGTVTDVEKSGGQQSIYSGRNVNESASLTLTIPLNDLNRRSQVINAKVRLEKDRLNLLAAKRALITDVTNLINSIESQIKRYQLAQKQVKLAEQSYALQKKKQEAGIASALDVNNTQNQLIQAQSGLISAKIAYLNQLSALQRLLGTTLKAWQINLRYGE